MKFIFFNILILLLAQPVWANNLSLSNKTFFTNNTFDRIYFNENGQFQQQLEDKYDAIEAGGLLVGTWEFDSEKQEVCMRYTEPKLNMICFDIIKNTDKRGYSVFDKSGKRHFIWKDYRDGNWLLSVDGMEYMKAVYSKKIPSNNIDSDISKYFSGKILDGFSRILSYFQDQKNGFYRDFQSNMITPYTWSVTNGNIISQVKGLPVENSLFTLGTEFLEDKNPIAISYTKKSEFDLEGENFELINYQDHPQKSIFE